MLERCFSVRSARTIRAWRLSPARMWGAARDHVPPALASRTAPRVTKRGHPNYDGVPRGGQLRPVTCERGRLMRLKSLLGVACA